MQEQYLLSPLNYIKNRTQLLGQLGDLEQMKTGRLKVDFSERIEGRTRGRNITEALRLRVHDPLWMLARQWQMGEFRGNNAGTAMSVRCIVSERDCSSEPIEPRTERVNPRLDFFVRVESAVYLLDLVGTSTPYSRAQIPALRKEAIARCPIDWEAETAYVLGSAETHGRERELNRHLQQYRTTYGGRIFDGVTVYQRLAAGESFPGVTTDVRDRYLKWFAEKYTPVTTASRWSEQDLSYDVKATAGNLSFRGDRYEGGRLSWHTFDYDPNPEAEVPATPATPQGSSSGMVHPTNFPAFTELTPVPADITGTTTPAGQTTGTTSTSGQTTGTTSTSGQTTGTPTILNSATRLTTRPLKQVLTNVTPLKEVTALRTAGQLSTVAKAAASKIPVAKAAAIAQSAAAAQTATPKAAIIAQDPPVVQGSAKILATATPKVVTATVASEVATATVASAIPTAVSDTIAKVAAAQRATAPTKRQVLTLPTPVSFASAPNKRLWQMEDHKVYLGNSLDQQSEGNVVAMKFATMYANDWMLFPLQTQIGKYIEVERIEVVNTFGRRTIIKGSDRAGVKERLRADQEPWQVFTNTTRGQRGRTDVQGLFYVPQLAATVEGRAIEEVKILRDEMANMVWGVEECVSDGCGGTLDAHHYAARLSTYVDSLNEAGFPQREAETVTFTPGTTEATVEGGTSTAKFRYILQSQVPYNWIPFVPQRLATVGDAASPFFLGGREMALRRGKMPCYVYDRTIDDFKLWPVRPMGDIMRPKQMSEISGKIKESPLVIHEEAVQATGIRLTRNYQRTRWMGGEVFTWLGIFKRQASTPATSGLRFDELEEK